MRSDPFRAYLRTQQVKQSFFLFNEYFLSKNQLQTVVDTHTKSHTTTISKINSVLDFEYLKALDCRPKTSLLRQLFELVTVSRSSDQADQSSSAHSV